MAMDIVDLPIKNGDLPSGKHTKNYGKIHHAINGYTNGKTHYFDWAIFNSYFDITRGYGGILQ